jgi:hypothetical protein
LNTSIIPITITGIQVDGIGGYDESTRVITVPSGPIFGFIANVPFTIFIQYFVIEFPIQNEENCAMLNLSVSPIHVTSSTIFNMDSSEICLTIKAKSGFGLLGDHFCTLPQESLLKFTETLAILQDILTIVLSLNQHLVGPNQLNPNNSICTGNCELVAIALGPVKFELLGAVIESNRCDSNEEAIGVCVSTNAGQSAVSNLVCSLASP